MEWSDYSIATMPPTRRQQLLAATVAALLVVGLLTTVPFAAVQLARIDSFVPTVQAIIFVTDLTTSVLLFSQYPNIGSRSLLVLADGYLFAALIVVPHALSYPGAFAPGGLLVHGLQTTPWLYLLWHLGFAVAVLAYACLKSGVQDDRMVEVGSYPQWILANVVATVGVVAALTLIAIAEEEYLPHLVTNQVSFAPLASEMTAITLIISVAALAILWFRRESILDLWLSVAIFATVAELLVVSFLIPGRFSLGFYSSRIFSVAVSTIVLMAILSETVAVYARLARANRSLQREREGKLMNLEVAVAAIAHEVRQPLTGIATKSAAARRFLSREPPDIPRVQAILDEVVGAGFRTNEVIESVRALFRSSEKDQRPVDLNDVTLEALQMLRKDFDDHDITLTTQLTPELPLIMGHQGQLREVVINLLQNAIDAMAGVVDRRRRVRIETERHEGTVAVMVEDSGPGIDSEALPGIFDAFVTTKAKGMGLGLAISQMIVERHHGQIAVTPGAIRGVRFRVTLPIKTTGDAAVAAS